MTDHKWYSPQYSSRSAAFSLLLLGSTAAAVVAAATGAGEVRTSSITSSSTSWNRSTQNLLLELVGADMRLCSFG